MPHSPRSPPPGGHHAFRRPDDRQPARRTWMRMFGQRSWRPRRSTHSDGTHGGRSGSPTSHRRTGRPTGGLVRFVLMATRPAGLRAPNQLMGATCLTRSQVGRGYQAHLRCRRRGEPMGTGSPLSDVPQMGVSTTSGTLADPRPLSRRSCPGKSRVAGSSATGTRSRVPSNPATRGKGAAMIYLGRGCIGSDPRARPAPPRRDARPRREVCHALTQRSRRFRSGMDHDEPRKPVQGQGETADSF
ncbi:hypothetical protein SUDANB9_06127 [Streptomyces sp. enrichment culture]